MKVIFAKRVTAIARFDMRARIFLFKRQQRRERRVKAESCCSLHALALAGL